jgi:hypothetical protein
MSDSEFGHHIRENFERYKHRKLEDVTKEIDVSADDESFPTKKPRTREQTRDKDGDGARKGAIYADSLERRALSVGEDMRLNDTGFHVVDEDVIQWYKETFPPTQHLLMLGMPHGMDKWTELERNSWETMPGAFER